jgi:hypothetical protein
MVFSAEMCCEDRTGGFLFSCSSAEPGEVRLSSNELDFVFSNIGGYYCRDRGAVWTGCDFEASVELSHSFAHSLDSNSQLEVYFFEGGEAWNTSAVVLDLNPDGVRALTDLYLRGLGSGVPMDVGQ